MKKVYRHLLAALCLAFILGLGLSHDPLTAKAASTTYVKMHVTKTGTYERESTIFKLVGNDYKYAVYQTNASGNYVATPIVSDFTDTDSLYINNQYILYFKSNQLCRYDYKTRKNIVLRTFSSASGNSYVISAIYKTKVFITKTNSKKATVNTYSYDLTTKAFATAKSNYEIIARKGSYVVAKKGFTTYPFGVTLCLYHITNSGLTYVCKLSNCSMSSVIINGSYIYYSNYSRKDTSKVALYRIKYNGTGKELLFQRTARGDEQNIVIESANANFCIFTDADSTGNASYQYEYATKTLTPIEY